MKGGWFQDARKIYNNQPSDTPTTDIWYGTQQIQEDYKHYLYTNHRRPNSAERRPILYYIKPLLTHTNHTNHSNVEKLKKAKANKKLWKETNKEKEKEKKQTGDDGGEEDTERGEKVLTTPEAQPKKQEAEAAQK